MNHLSVQLCSLQAELKNNILTFLTGPVFKTELEVLNAMLVFQCLYFHSNVILSMWLLFQLRK